MTEEHQEVLVEAIGVWGDSQIVKAAEEMAEFSAALSKYWLQKDAGSFDALLDEYVDAKIMIWQMERMMNLEAHTTVAMEVKVARLARRLTMIQEGREK